MKKITRFVCMLLVLGVFLAIPAYAQTVVEPRGSAFFSSYGTDLYKTGTRTFQIWFDVNSNLTTMDELGVSEIIVYRSADGQSWTQMRCYDMEDYSQMIAYNTGSHIDYVTYDYATPGYYYTAYITFYAKNSTGIGERDVYTEIIRM